MADDFTGQDFSGDNMSLEEVHALDAALAQARAELDAITKAASTAGQNANQANAEYSLHAVDGVGRYAIARHLGWKPLIKILHDPAADINFSLKEYPVFDAVIGERFQSPHLIDPLDEQYESYGSLRDNIAAVRNFLMESYYAKTPAGMTPEKASKALQEIAAFVGDGLYNNWRLFGVIPNHDPTKPFIALDAARAGNGAGAQYIYEKILEMHRHSNWMRPFAAVASLFGGKPAPDWMLPPASDTYFKEGFAGELIAGTTIGKIPTRAEIDAAFARVNRLEAKRAELSGAHELSMMATDLDAMGSHLLFTAETINTAENLAEPVRRDAIDIAREILRKLKVSMGGITIRDGLKLKPTDDMAALGAVKGVAMVYERLISWAKGIDASIMQHPSIAAATQAIGQLGYLAKREALNMALAAGNAPRASQLQEQLSRLPPNYVPANTATFGSLLETIDNGIMTILNRTQAMSVPGAKVGHSAGNELGTYMGAAPTAGMSTQLGGETGGIRDGAGKRNAEIMAAEEMAAQAQAARIQSQNAARDRASGTSTTPQRPTTGRQAVQQARTGQRQQQTQQTANTSTAPAIAQTAAQRQQAALTANRNASLRSAHDAEEHQAHDMQLQQALRQVNLQQLNKMKASVSTTGLTNAPVTTGRQAYDKTMAARTGQQPPAAPRPPTTPTVTDKSREQQLAAPQPVPPNKGGRGF